MFIYRIVSILISFKQTIRGLNEKVRKILLIFALYINIQLCNE